MRAAFARRARLVPMIYTALHGFSQTGVSALHPVYYDAPVRLPGHSNHLLINDSSSRVGFAGFWTKSIEPGCVSLCIAGGGRCLRSPRYVHLLQRPPRRTRDKPSKQHHTAECTQGESVTSNIAILTLSIYNGAVICKVWLPRGRWVDTVSGVETVVDTDDGIEITREYTLWEV